MSQPMVMRTSEYRYGIDIVDGNDAWEMFCAAADGDVAAISRLADKDERLVNAQFWYHFPLHLASWQNHSQAVKCLLQRGADIGCSHWRYRSWDQLLPFVQQRGFDSTAKLLQRAMRRKFAYDPDFEPLKVAALERNLRTVRRLLKKNPKLIRLADSSGNRLVHLGVLTRQRDLIDLALNLGASLEDRRADGMSPVLLAIHGTRWGLWNGPQASHRWTMAGFLLGKGAKLELSSAAALGEVDACRQMLDADPELATKRNAARQSPLMYAARSGQKEVVQLLLDRGADPNQPEWNSETGAALHAASGENFPEIMKLLLEHGANPNGEMDSCDSCLGIVKHVHKGRHQKAWKLLKDHGAIPPVYHLSPKQLSGELQSGNMRKDRPHEVTDCLAAILKSDQPGLVDQFVKICGGEPVATMTAMSGVPRSRAMLEKLREHGLDINRPDWSGRTLLHSLAESSSARRSLIVAFLDHGADLEAVDLEYSTTPLGRAALAGQLKTVQWLLKLGASPAGRNGWRGGQPAALARHGGHEPVVAVLKDAAGEK